MKYILSLDQGTTGTTAVLIDAITFQLIGKENVEFKQHFPRPGLVEHDLEDIWSSVRSATLALIQKNSINHDEIVAIGITNQRETTCAFDTKGKPLHNAIVWQDRRTDSFCKKIKSSKQNSSYIKRTTGLTIDPYFSGSKIRWLLDNSTEVKKALKSKTLRVGTIDTFLLYRLTNYQSFATESTNASRTMLMSLKNISWDKKLLEIFNIPISILPEIKPSFFNFGSTSGLDFLPDGIPITGILGDQQAALFGQAGISEGGVKCTYGTGAFMLLNTGKKIVHSKRGLLTTVAYNDGVDTFYALEGSCYIAGAAVQWLRDNMKFIKSSADVEETAKKATENEMEHVMFLPFFTGIGSPYWNSNVKAAIIGMTRDTGISQIARACLDGIALSINDLFEAMKKDLSVNVNELRVDGGACSNNLLMEIQASICNLKIIRPKIIETTAYGAGLAAAIGAKITTIDKVSRLWKKDKQFNVNKKIRSYMLKKKDRWDLAIQMLEKAF